MLTATTVELYDGLVRPRAGRPGAARSRARPGRYDRMHAHCDVLVVGAGPAGLAAALGRRALGRPGDPGRRAARGRRRPAGAARRSTAPRRATWLARRCAELAAHPEVRVLTAHDRVRLLRRQLPARRRAAHRPPRRRRARASLAQRVWRIRAAAGRARDRRARAADRLRRQRPARGSCWPARRGPTSTATPCCPGARAVVFTTNDSAYAAALDLRRRRRRRRGGRRRPRPGPGGVAERVRVRGNRRPGRSRRRRHGRRRRLDGVRVAPLDDDGALAGPSRTFGCDLLAGLGRLEPGRPPVQPGRRAAALRPAARRVRPGGPLGRPTRWSAPPAASLADRLPGRGCAGRRRAATETGFVAEQSALPAAERTCALAAPRAVGSCPARTRPVDQRTSSTCSATRRSPTFSARPAPGCARSSTSSATRPSAPAHDQGKTSGVIATGVDRRSARRRRSPSSARPPSGRPYTPVVVRGPGRPRPRRAARPGPGHARSTPGTSRTARAFENVGQWKRPWYYPQPGEDMERGGRCANARAAREPASAFMDASTLGKIDVQGPDAGVFLDLRLHQPDVLAEGRHRSATA